MNKNQKKKNFNNDIKVYSLGGLGVVGMNMYIVECADELIIMDAGVLFADDDAHGVSYIIPDFTHLINNQKKIIGLFITHGHEDHIGALPFLLKKVNIPKIYANGLAIGLIRNKLSEYDLNPHIEEYQDDSLYKFKNFSVSFFRTNHSIPDSFGIAIKTRLGYIVNTGDFKFDFTPIGQSSDYYKMAKLGEDGVLCLLSDSTNADIPKFSSSERKIGETLSNLFHQINGRIIVATFASNVYRVQQIIQASIETKRKIIVFGHSMEKTIAVSTKLGYINVPKGYIYSSHALKRLTDERVTILCTGSQGEPLAALTRIANGSHKHIKLLPDDTVIYSSKPIPGNEQFVNRTINKLVHSGAHVIKNSSLTDTHTTGHASQSELQIMLSFMKPKYFMPAHGEYAMLKQHANIAITMGVKKENCFVLDPGDVLSFSEKGAKVLQKAIIASDVYLDSSLSDIDSNILKERTKMAGDGIINVTFNINKNKKLISKVHLETIGFMDYNQSRELENTIKQKATDFFNTTINNSKSINIKRIEREIINSLAQYIYQKIERRPLIVPIINVI